MTQFTSSAKTITYYLDTASTRKLEQMYGSRLERLSQEEKYQLCTAIALMLWGCCEPTEDDQGVTHTSVQVCESKRYRGSK